MKSFGVSQRSELAGICGALALLAALSVWFFAANGYVLYYGDAQAHLNISRSVLDSRTPGPDQLGTVWLPMLHVLCLPLVGNDWLWSSGLAGSIPVVICFFAAGVFLYLAAREVFVHRFAALAALAGFALNPNVLYLGSVPMTEVVFLAGLSGFLFCFVRYRADQRNGYLAGALAASWFMSLTRYDGWFLIPFEAVWLAAVTKNAKIRVLFLFGALASLAPLAWIAHDWYWTGNPLDFFNGPYSASAIQGNRSYPGLHNWRLAIQYYAAAARLCCGWGLVIVGAIGFVFSCTARSSRWPAILLLLTPLFYVWSIHSSAIPIFVPELYPHGYYNTRYGIVTVLLFAFCSGALADRLARWKLRLSFAPAVLSVLPWLLRPSPAAWICWKESDVNSVARRAWTAEMASYFQTHYVTGEGILTDFGDMTGVYCKARIPLRETLQVGNGPQWYATIDRPDLSHPTEWAVAPKGDALFRSLARSPERVYSPVYEISVPGAAPVEIFSRTLPVRER